MAPRALVILGSTGSIGQSTLDLVRRFPDRFSTEILVAGKRVDLLARDIKEFRPKVALVENEAALTLLKAELGLSTITDTYQETLLGSGSQAVCEAVRESAAPVVVAGIVGMAGLPGVMAAAKAGKIIALANKESLVVAGKLVASTVEKYGATVIPVDSEHSAIYQCLQGLSAERRSDLTSVILTSSGGPFRTTPLEHFASITVEQALKHPKWSMGAKITIDSATMMNKALEVIEAHWLFNIPPDAIEVVVHPEHIIHSFVRFCDGSVLGQLALPDMRGPISLAINFPHGRLAGAIPHLDLYSMGALHFEAVDPARFPSVGRAYEVLRSGGGAPAVFNAANEVAVQAFLQGRIKFLSIERLVNQALEHFAGVSYESLDEVLALCDEVAAWSLEHIDRLR
jgi:1-deoxy-D-xylulose-5-phosphate reductoisomerase